MEGDLAYAQGGKLAFKLGDVKDEGVGNLVFKRDRPCATLITFAWGVEGSDLDILAYWADEPTLTAGYKNGSGGTKNGYRIAWSGDKRGPDNGEWVRVSKTPWGNSERKFIVHLNFYGYDPEDYPLDSCTVIVNQLQGGSRMIVNQPCGTSHLSKALQSHPYVEITFDDGGKLVSAESKFP